MRLAAALVISSFALAPALARADELCARLPGDQTSFVDLYTLEPARAFLGDHELGETPIAGAKLPLGCLFIRFELIEGGQSFTASVQVGSDRGRNSFVYSLANGPQRLASVPGVGFVSDLKMPGLGKKQTLCAYSPFVIHAREALERGDTFATHNHLLRARLMAETCAVDMLRLHVLMGGRADAPLKLPLP